MSATFGPAIGWATALRRAAEAQARHNDEVGHPKTDWYAQHIEGEQSGRSGMANPITIS